MINPSVKEQISKRALGMITIASYVDLMKKGFIYSKARVKESTFRWITLVKNLDILTGTC